MVAPADIGAGAEVRLDGLVKHYGDVVAVDDISVVTAAGTFFTLLGSSGSGKTTTLMMVAGFVTPTRGDIYLDGRRMTAVPPHKRDLGVVFQNYAVFPHLTVFDNVAFPLEARKKPRAEIRRLVGEMLDLVQLQGLERRLPRHLSGGQQQRVALARALVFRPRVLLMDEPLGALDKKLRTQMQLEIKHLQQRLHVTVLYVTHDQDEALTMSDQIAVMHRGRIVQIGTPTELYETPANRFVADFLGESNFLNGTIAEVEGAGRYLLRGPGFQFRGVGPESLVVGQPVSVAIRPEKLVFEEGAPPGLNAVKGVVEEAIYAGGFTRYRVHLGTDAALTVAWQNRAATRSCRPGDQITVAWDPLDTRLFARDGHGG